MQKGYIRKQELKGREDGILLAAIANGKLQRRGGGLFTFEDFIPRESKDIDVEERKARAEDAKERSKRFDKGVKIEEYG